MAAKLEQIGGVLFGGFLNGCLSLFPVLRVRRDNFRAPAEIATTSAATYTMAQIARGIIRRDPSGASRTDTLPTAALLIDGTGSYQLNENGDALEFRVDNTADAAETITLAAGANCSIAGDLVLLRGEARIVRVTRLTSTTCAIQVTNPLALQGVTTVPATTITTAGAGTYSAAALLGGYIARDPAGASRTDTTATAAQLNTAAPTLQVGAWWDIQIANTADANETITLAGGSGVTLIGTIDIAQNETAFVRIVKTADAAFLIREL